jgi:hypothetical protein
VPPQPPLPKAHPVTAETGWNDLTRTLGHEIPKELAKVATLTRGFRALRGR